MATTAEFTFDRNSPQGRMLNAMRGASTQGEWLYILNEWGRMTAGPAFQRYRSAGAPVDRLRVAKKTAADITPGQKRAVKQLLSGGATGGIGGWVQLLQAFGQYTVGAAFQRSLDAMRTGDPEIILRMHIDVDTSTRPWPQIFTRRTATDFVGSRVSRAGA